MTTTAQNVITSKIGMQFDALDANHDGYLDGTDYEKLADRYIQACVLDSNDRRARAIQAFCQVYWLELLRHSGVDGDRLTKEQFVMANRLASIDTSRVNMVEGGGHAFFDAIDIDGNNEIDRAEFARFMKNVWNTESPEVMNAFDQLDTDGDGVISRQEFIRSVREHFLSGDPDAPGSLFFGHV